MRMRRLGMVLWGIYDYYYSCETRACSDAISARTWSSVAEQTETDTRTCVAVVVSAGRSLINMTT